MNTILAIVIVLNVATFGVLIYRHSLLSKMQRLQKAIQTETEKLRDAARLHLAHAQKTAVLAEQELAHEVCSECSKIVTRYDKDVNTAKVTCIDCISKIASRAL